MTSAHAPRAIPLPAQPNGVPWPTERWPEAEPAADVDPEGIDAELDLLFREPPPEDTGETHALLIVAGGRSVAERRASGVDAGDALPSWSMAKSILHALVGVAVRDGKLDVRDSDLVPAWTGDDPRRAITLDQLLRMSSGLAFNEDYVDAETSDAIEMLFGSGKDDVSGYAAAQPLEHAPDEVFSYSSGTSNIVARVLGRALGLSDESAYAAFMRRELFDRIGMRSAAPRFDATGCFIGSSFVFATARDFARFGLLYLRDGIWEGERLLPAGWVDYARTPTPSSELREYGAHWWLARDGTGTFSANGYRGQYTVVVPERDLVLVRLGNSTPEQRCCVIESLARLVRAFPEIPRATSATSPARP